MICWQAEQEFAIGVQVVTADDTAHSQFEELIVLDTGYDGEVLVPYELYLALDLDRWAEPDENAGVLQTVSGERLAAHMSHAFAWIPKLQARVPVAIDTFDGNTEFLIGLGLIRKFRILLDGPSEQVCILLENEHVTE